MIRIHTWSWDRPKACDMFISKMDQEQAREGKQETQKEG